MSKSYYHIFWFRPNSITEINDIVNMKNKIPDSLLILGSRNATDNEEDQFMEGFFYIGIYVPYVGVNDSREFLKELHDQSWDSDCYKISDEDVKRIKDEETETVNKINKVIELQKELTKTLISCVYY